MKSLPKQFALRRIPAQPRAWFALAAVGLVSGLSLAQAASPKLDQALVAYDTAIQADTTATALAKLTAPVTLDGTAGSAFDFGATAGDTTMEFILQGDSNLTGDSGFLAVGENSSSSLRYEQWQNTHQLGFTQGGVADYMFSPAVSSPTTPTHLTYVWNSTELTMSLYVNGTLAGTATGVSDVFAMPTGAGFLGANPWWHRGRGRHHLSCYGLYRSTAGCTDQEPR